MVYSHLKDGGILHISVSGEITEWDSEEATLWIDGLNTADVKAVEIAIDTIGGDYFSAVAIANAIRKFDVPKTARVIGTCFSAGNTILLACEKRVAYPQTMFMIHNIISLFGGNVAEAKKQIENTEKIDADLLNSFVKTLKISESEIKTLMENEEFFTAQKAFEIGLITELSGDKTNKIGNTFSWLLAKAKATKQTTSETNEKVVAELEAKIANFYTNTEKHLKYLDVCKDKVLQNIREGKEFSAEIAENYAEIKIANMQREKSAAENQPFTPATPKNESNYLAIKNKLNIKGV